MGSCTSARQPENVPYWETSLENVEARLRFNSIKVLDIYTAFKVNSHNSTLNHNQLQAVSESLNLEIGINDSRVFDYYNNFLSTGLYNETELIHAGLFYGVGDPISKARLLFDLYDTQKDNKLPAQTIDEIWRKSFNIFFVKTRKLFLPTTDDPLPALEAKKEKLFDYLTTISTHCYNSISKEDFSKNIVKGLGPQFLTAPGFRLLLITINPEFILKDN